MTSASARASNRGPKGSFWSWFRHCHKASTIMPLTFNCAWCCASLLTLSTTHYLHYLYSNFSRIKRDIFYFPLLQISLKRVVLGDTRCLVFKETSVRSRLSECSWSYLCSLGQYSVVCCIALYVHLLPLLDVSRP